MNWDISIGHCKQIYGRLLQAAGQRLDRRRLVLDGERLEFGGRLQARYGMLKHHVQWNAGLMQFRRQSIPVRHDDDRLAGRRG
jgi:uncharacterized protein YjbJ (UPF0337 family)